jgi:hypothetical protein
MSYYNPPWDNYPQQYVAPYNRQYAPRPVAPQLPSLNGMVVQSAEVITADAVPMNGSFAVFPRQDLSEIYVKSWNPDGTIKTLTFRPTESSASVEINVEEQINALIAKVNDLEASINKIQNGKRNYNRKENNQS